MKKHGLKIITTTLSLGIFFSAMSGFTTNASATDANVVSTNSSNTNITSSVLRLDRQVGLSIGQKKTAEFEAAVAQAEAERLEAEAQAQAQAAAKAASEEAARLAKLKTNSSSKSTNKTSTSTAVAVNSSIGDKVVSFAMSKIGTPYGAVINGVTYDCSGLVQWAYRQAGVSLSRSSYSQINECNKISSSEARPGDLIFWQTGGTINHVGIYAGGGSVIDASPRGVVKRSIFNTNSQKVACYGRPRY